MRALDTLMVHWAPTGLLVLGLVTVVSLGLFGLGLALDWGEHRAVRGAWGMSIASIRGLREAPDSGDAA